MREEREEGGYMKKVANIEWAMKIFKKENNAVGTEKKTISAVSKQTVVHLHLRLLHILFVHDDLSSLNNLSKETCLKEDLVKLFYQEFPD